jgi:hypothetical protein
VRKAFPELNKREKETFINFKIYYMEDQSIILVNPENFEDIVRAGGKETKVFVLFSGDKDENGKSWCPDCV